MLSQYIESKKVKKSLKQILFWIYMSKESNPISIDWKNIDKLMLLN